MENGHRPTQKISDDPLEHSHNVLLILAHHNSARHCVDKRALYLNLPLTLLFSVRTVSAFIQRSKRSRISMSIRIIGITGTLGAGKGTVVEYLCRAPHNFEHYSARRLLNGIIAKQGLEPGRDSMRKVANELRQERGPAAVIEALFEEAVAAGKDAIIESVRTEGEVVALRKSGKPFVLLAVDADQKIRYERAIGRGSSTDKVTFEKFCEQESVEMASQLPHEQNLSRCMELADVRLTNDGTIEEFQAKIDVFLSSAFCKDGAEAKE